MENIWKPRGALKSQMPTAGDAVLRQVPMLGIVKDNVDPVRSGRIRVFISALGGKDPDDENNWTPVLFMSSFFGMTDPNGGKTGYGSYKNNPASYGVWCSPPDVGSLVVCLFINGDPNFGFYIGGIPDAEALRMIPAIGANFTTEKVTLETGEASSYGGATRLPVTNMNTNNSSEADNSTFLNSPKPVHSFQASIMFQQGVLRDPVRGPISSSAQRESPSRVGWGVSTPGRPIYEGGFTDETIVDAAGNASQQSGLKIISRRGGHSIVMDDGDQIGQDNLIRIRTSLGHQILMSDDGQTMMFLHSNGQSYIELGKEGTVDVYATNSINLRTQGDLNLHADNDININAKKKLNIQADEININSENSINQKAGKDYKVFTQGKHTHKVEGAMSMASAGEASFASSSTTYINGSIINLNTGQTSTTPQVVPPIPFNAQTDTLFDSSKGWAASPGSLLTIVTRSPAHAPWANAGQGVDVKVNLNASAVLPGASSQAAASVNNTAATTATPAPVTVAGAATVPPTAAVSTALDKNTTSAVVGAMAAQAAAGPAASAIQAGAGLVKDSTGAVTGIAAGVIGMNANALEASNIIKPGSAPLVNALVQGGATIQAAMPSSLFTGQAGITTLPAFVNSASAQVGAAVTTLQQSQTALTQSGIITGNEGPAGVAGMVMSAATNGITSTVSAIKNVTGAVGSVITGAAGAITGAASAVMNSISGGNFAANMSQNITSGLSGISKAVSSITGELAGVIDSAKGVAANAFAAVTKSFKPFEANVPQDLKAIATKNKAEAEAASNSVPGALGAAAGALGAAAGAVSGTLGSVLPTSASALASGISALPGAAATISNVINNTAGAVNSIPGAAGITSLINNASTGSINGISLQNSITAATGLASTLGGISSGTVGSALQSGLGVATALTSGLPNISGLAAAGSSLLATGAGALGALDKLKSGSASLASLASTGLSSADASQLNSAIASLSSGGSLPIKIPTVAFNTVDRGELNAAIGSVLPAGIPKPNFSGVSTTSITSAEAQLKEATDKLAKVRDLQKQFDEQKKVMDTAIVAYQQAKYNLPPGDPQVDALRQQGDVELKKLIDLQKQIGSVYG